MSDRKMVIHTSRQMAELFHGSKIVKTYIVSTAANGVGCVEGSNCTPLGKLKVANKIGHDLALGAVLKSRIPTGEYWSATSVASEEDLVLTRILWLEGAEEHNANTKNRFIYLHGTNQEHLLGKAVSHGCIRFSNQDILEVFEFLSEGSEVEIV